MTRTGTLAFSRVALFAALVGWAGVALAQRSTQSSPDSAGWTTQGASNPQRSYRRADSSAAAWKPTRSESAQAKEAVEAPSESPRNWLAPTQATGRAQAAAAKPSPSRQVKQSAARAPEPFTPPTNAKRLAAAERPAASRSAGNVVELAAPAATKSRPRASASSSAARVSQSAARVNSRSTPNTRPTPRTPQDRVSSNRPRPTPTQDNRWFDDSWIRPAKQVAYQAGETEELYAPPGEESRMMMRGSRMLEHELPSDGEWIGSPDGVPYGDDDCGPMCGDGVGCCSTCGQDSGNCSCYIDLFPGLHDSEACEEVRIRIPKVYTLMVNAGVHGFKGPFDQDRDSGNFGFQEGVNMGFKVPLTNLGYQIGYQTTQSQLSGDGDTGIVNGFPQHFLTAGVFRRSRDGFQGGVVWDWMLDERNTSVVDFSQIRGELGFVDRGCHEFGASIAVHLNDNLLVDQQQQTTAFQSVDQYLLYYRMHGARGGEGRVYGGLTDDADGLVGADFLLPLTERWSLQPAFTYLIPKDNGGSIAAREEAWNIGINLVWHWKGQARACHSSPYRPLFNVADNGYMIIDDRP